MCIYICKTFEHSKCRFSKREREIHSNIKTKWYIKPSPYLGWHLESFSSTVAQTYEEPSQWSSGCYWWSLDTLDGGWYIYEGECMMWFGWL